jgi:hypothetical protein
LRDIGLPFYAIIAFIELVAYQRAYPFIDLALQGGLVVFPAVCSHRHVGGVFLELEPLFGACKRIAVLFRLGIACLLPTIGYRFQIHQPAFTHRSACC